MEFWYILFGIVSVPVGILALCMVFDYATDNRPLWGFIFLACAVALWGSIYSDGAQKAYDEGHAERETREAECRRVKEVTEQDGVRLYVYQPSCGSHPVYFSRSGTMTTETIHHGKTSETVRHDVPNAEAP